MDSSGVLKTKVPIALYWPSSQKNYIHNKETKILISYDHCYISLKYLLKISLFPWALTYWVVQSPIKVALNSFKHLHFDGSL